MAVRAQVRGGNSTNRKARSRHQQHPYPPQDKEIMRNWPSKASSRAPEYLFEVDFEAYARRIQVRRAGSMSIAKDAHRVPKACKEVTIPLPIFFNQPDAESQNEGEAWETAAEMAWSPPAPASHTLSQRNFCLHHPSQRGFDEENGSRPLSRRNGDLVPAPKKDCLSVCLSVWKRGSSETDTTTAGTLEMASKRPVMTSP